MICWNCEHHEYDEEFYPDTGDEIEIHTCNIGHDCYEQTKNRQCGDFKED